MIENVAILEGRIASLQQSIDTGVLSVEYPGVARTTFRSMTEMQTAMADLRRRLRSATGVTVRPGASRIVLTSRSGF